MCVCRLDKIICNSKQGRNEDKCRCECKEIIEKDVCDKGFIFNPSNCECECDKSCSIGEYLDYSNCRCRKKLVDPLAEECTENIDDTKLVNITVEIRVTVDALLMMYIRCYFGYFSYSL